MKKLSKYFMIALMLPIGCLMSCSGSSDDNGGDKPSGEIEGPIELEVDKATIEANGIDKVTFKVTDKNGVELTTPEYIKDVYFKDVKEDAYLERKTNSFTAVENGKHTFKAYYMDLESGEKEVTAQNRKNYEVFYRKLGVFKMTGTWCTYCPEMTSALKKVEETMPNRMVKMAFHSSSSDVTDPFHLSQTGTLMSRFGAKGYPTNIYDLKEISVYRTVSAIKEMLNSHLRKYPATCGIKINSVYDAASSTIKVNASLKSSKGGEYDLVYVLVTDGLQAAGGNESYYDYTVRAISNNYMSMATDTKFTVAKDAEHSANEFTISGATGLNKSTSRVIVYALTKVDEAYMVDNITECSIDGSVDYIYNN